MRNIRFPHQFPSFQSSLSSISAGGHRCQEEHHLWHVHVRHERLLGSEDLPGHLFHQLLSAAPDDHQRAVHADDHAAVAPGNRCPDVQGVPAGSQEGHPPGRRGGHRIRLTLAARPGELKEPNMIILNIVHTNSREFINSLLRKTVFHIKI